MSGVQWAPSLPSGWGGAKLRWLARIFAGGTPDKTKLEYWTDGTIPWLNSGSVNDAVITEPSARITDDAYRSSSAKWIPARSVVMALAGQGRTKGMAARLEIASTCNQSMAAIVPGPRLEYRFLQYWLTANYQNIRNLAGGDKRDGLNLVHVGSIEVPLPAVREQRAIADFLDRETAQIDTLIAKQQRLIATLRERRAALIDRMAVGRMDPLDSAAKGDWPVTALGFGFSVVLGKMLDAGKTRDEAAEDRPYIRAANIKDHGLDLSDVKTMPFTPEESSKFDLKRDDLLVVEGGAIGTSVVLREDLPGWSYQKTVNRLRGHGGWNPQFYAYVLLSYRDRGVLDILANKSTIAHLTAEKLRALRVPVPPVGEQDRIVSYLNEQTARIDTLIQKSERLIELSQERRAALITAAVTGQIDVRKAA